MLDRDELPGYRVIPLTRMSDVSAKSESSLNLQDKKISEEIDILETEYDGVVVDSFANKQSASSMDRETLNEIYEMAKNDEFDILMVWKIHRLTRASPIDTMRYLIKLSDQGIILYSYRDSYYDWTDPDDNRLLMDRVSTSKAWRDEIHFGSISANKEILLEGKYPNGRIGYGLTTAEDDEILIKEGYEKIIDPIFKAFIGCEDEEITARSVENKIANDNLSIDSPTSNQIKTTLENELYIGDLVEPKSGDKVREKDDLKVLDPTLFDKVQDILSDSDDKKNIPDEDELPSKIYDIISRYGQEYIVDNVSGIRWCCPECSSTNINVSSTTIEYLDINIPRIYCNNDSEDCGYQGPAIRKRELNEIDMCLPFICPECQRTEGFDVEEIDLTDNKESNEEMYRYTCEHCGSSMIKSADPDPNVRGLHSSSNAISLRSKTEQDDTRDVNEAKSDNKKNENKLTTEVITVLEAYLEKEGPNKPVAREAMITAANVLTDDGPMTTANLKDELKKAHSEKYASKKSLWESTFARLYSDIPGFTKVSHGEYDFNDQQLEVLIDSIQNL